MWETEARFLGLPALTRCTIRLRRSDSKVIRRFVLFQLLAVAVPDSRKLQPVLFVMIDVWIGYVTVVLTLGTNFNNWKF